MGLLDLRYGPIGCEVWTYRVRGMPIRCEVCASRVRGMCL